MNEDALIKQVLGEFYPAPVRMPQMVKKVFDKQGYNMSTVLRHYAVRMAIELDPDNEKLKELKKLLNK